MNRPCSRTLGLAALIIVSTPAVAEPPELTSGSVLTSGMVRTLPLNSILAARNIAAGGSVTAIQACDRSWLGIGSDGAGLIRNLPATATAIAIGNAHGVAIVGPRQLMTWGAVEGASPVRGGEYDGGALAAVVPLSDWHGVAAGGSHTAALTKSGELYMAGANDFGQCIAPPSDGWTNITLGGSHSLGINSSGATFAWGLNSSMQASVPAALEAKTTLSIAAGLTHSAAVTTSGGLYGWGSNAQGQIAFGNNSESTERAWKAVCAGALHTVAIDRDGVVQAWGDDRYDQCSLAGKGVRTRSNVESVACGLYHTALLDSSPTCNTTTSRVFVAGANFYGEAGTPAEPLVDVACGDGFVVGLLQDRSIKVWGSRNDGIQNPPSGSFAQCAAGPRHAGAIDSAGYLFMWGSPADYRTTPPSILKTERWTRLACGTKHSVGLLNTGAVRAWGSNSAGQTSVPAGILATAVTAGPYFSGAVQTSGSPAIWGSNPTGALTPPAGIVVREMSAGAEHIVGLTPDGKVCAWGDNSRQQLAVPTMGTALAVCASESTSGALLSDGSVRFWGQHQDINGQWHLTTAPVLPSTTADGRQLRAHRISAGGGSVAVLVGHEYLADFNKGPYWTIQEAIDAAPVGAVVTVAPGRWRPEQISADRTGLKLNGDITLTAQHPDADYDPTGARGRDLNATVLEGTTNNGLNRVTGSLITVWNNESPACIIRGFKFYLGQRGQMWPENPVSVVGGAIYVGQNSRAEFCEGTRFIGASPTIERCYFDRCYAGYGGGIYLSRSRASIRNCVFWQCQAQTSGGAIYGWAFNGLIENCAFQENSAIDKDGGAVGFVTVSDSFQWCSSNCDAAKPARVPCDLIAPECATRYDRGAPVLRSCSFLMNSAYAFGGALAYTLQYRHPDATGSDGSKLRNMQCYDCTFSQNVSKNGGGGICVFKSDFLSGTPIPCPYASPSGIELQNCTGVDNISENAGTGRMSDLQGDWVDLGNNNFNRIGSPCPFDIDNDGTVDYGDLAIVLLLMGSDSFADFDNSGLVDFGDVNLMLLSWGPCV